MEPTRREAEEPEQRPEWDAKLGVIDGPKQLLLGAAVWQARAGQRDTGDPKHSERQAEQGGELLNTSAELDDLLTKFRLRELGDVQAHHGGWRDAEPSPCRQTRDPEHRGDGDVAGSSDEFAEPMVVALLGTSRGHRTDHPLPRPAALNSVDESWVVLLITRAEKFRMS